MFTYLKASKILFYTLPTNGTWTPPKTAPLDSPHRLTLQPKVVAAHARRTRRTRDNSPESPAQLNVTQQQPSSYPSAVFSAITLVPPFGLKPCQVRRQPKQFLRSSELHIPHLQGGSSQWQFNPTGLSPCSSLHTRNRNHTGKVRVNYTGTTPVLRAQKQKIF